MLEQDVATWAQMGNPCLLQRFVLRHGKPFTPGPRVGRRRKPKQCYANATNFVLDRRKGNNGSQYVEGFVLNTKLPIMPIHHAWVTLDGTTAMDPTLDAENYEYFGIVFSNETLREELVRNRFYGVLDPGVGLNARLMFAMDPSLESLCKQIRPSLRFRNAMETGERP
jgi:hypothetical protein